MKKPPSAVSPQELAAAAGRKTRRVQKKLHDAETDLRTANEVLAHADASRDAKDVHEAVARNSAAERKVHEAAEELEVVKEMLEHADPPAADGPIDPASGKSGHGVKSLLPHLKKTRHSRP